MPSSSFLKGVGIALIVVFLAPAAEPCCAEEDLRKRLLSEGPKAWRALAEFCFHLEGSYTVIEERTKTKSPSGPGLRLRRHEQFKMNGPCLLVREKWHFVAGRQGDRNTEAEMVRASNSTYEFRIQRSSDSMPFEMRLIGARSEENYKDLLDNGPGRWLRASYWDGPLDLEGFVIRRVESNRRNGRAFVRMDYSFKDVVPDASVLFDPDNYWCVIERQHTSHDKRSTQTCVVQYGDPIRGFPVIREVRFVGRSGDGLEEVVTKAEIESIGYRIIPPEEFAISAFGLPEMDPLYVKPPSRMWMWLIAMGIVVGIMTILCLAWRRRLARV